MDWLQALYFFLLLSSRTLRLFRASRKIPRLPRLAHGVPVMQASNGEEDDKKKPRTLSAVNKRQRRGYSDHKHVQRQRQNTAITMQTKPMKRGNTDCRLADRKFTVKIMFFDATIGSKNYTICKIQLRNIFPTDWGQPINLFNTPWATMGFTV